MTIFLLILSSLAQAGELKFDSYSHLVFFLNTSSSSCAEILDAKLERREAKQDITSRFFQIPNPTLSFKSENPNSQVTISEITMTLNSPKIQGGSHSCSIKGKELEALFAKDAETRWLGKLSPGTVLGTSNFCRALKCGGISLITSGPVRVITDLHVIGSELDSATGEVKPIEATSTYTIYNMN